MTDISPAQGTLKALQAKWRENSDYEEREAQKSDLGRATFCRGIARALDTCADALQPFLDREQAQQQEAVETKQASAGRYAEERRCCTVCDRSKVCSTCGTSTLFACSDCQIDLGTAVYVCSSSGCRDEHERKCSARLRDRVESQQQEIARLTTWQPIETAPKDGLPFLVFWRASIMEQPTMDIVAGWEEYEELLGYGEPPATHWMRPPPPEFLHQEIASLTPEGEKS